MMMCILLVCVCVCVYICVVFVYVCVAVLTFSHAHTKQTTNNNTTQPQSYPMLIVPTENTLRICTNYSVGQPIIVLTQLTNISYELNSGGPVFFDRDNGIVYFIEYASLVPLYLHAVSVKAATLGSVTSYAFSSATQLSTHLTALLVLPNAATVYVVDSQVNAYSALSGPMLYSMTFAGSSVSLEVLVAVLPAPVSAMRWLSGPPNVQLLMAGQVRYGKRDYFPCVIFSFILYLFFIYLRTLSNCLNHFYLI